MQGLNSRGAFSWLLKVSNEPASAREAGRRFHSVIVRGMKECSNSLVLLWICVVLVRLSAGRNPRSAGVSVTVPCTILYIRVRRCCCLYFSRLSTPRSSRMSVMLNLKEWLPWIHLAALQCAASSIPLSLARWGSQIVALYSSSERTKVTYAMHFNCCGHPFRFLLRKPTREFAFFTPV